MQYQKKTLSQPGVAEKAHLTLIIADSLHLSDPDSHLVRLCLTSFAIFIRRQNAWRDTVA